MIDTEREERIRGMATAFHKSLGCFGCEGGEPCEGLEKMISMVQREVEPTTCGRCGVEVKLTACVYCS